MKIETKILTSRKKRVHKSVKLDKRAIHRSVCLKVQKESFNLFILTRFFVYFNKAADLVNCYVISFTGNR